MMEKGLATHDESTPIDEPVIIPNLPSTTVEEPTPPPELTDGGLRAWLQVLGGFILFFNVWGYTFAYGAFQAYYTTSYLSDSTASAISWIGSIQSFLLIVSGLFSGPLFDLGFFKTIIYCGASLSTVGSMMLSLSHRYWQIFLTQGFCIGVGCGVLYAPTVALVARSFKKKRSMAIGVMSTGAPVGAIIYNFMFEGLLPKLGFAWTVRTMSFFMFATYLVAIPLVIWRANNIGDLGKGTRRKLIDLEAMKDGPFWSFTLATATIFLAYLVPYFYMPTYANVELGVSSSLASSVLAISQAASIPGRILATMAAHKIGVMIPWVLCAVMSGILCLTWISIKEFPTFVAFCALYGFFSGALVPLPPSIFPVVCQDPTVLGTRLGMSQGMTSIANLIGPPIAGALLHSHDNDKPYWLGVQLFSGLVLLFGFIQVVGLWVLLVKTRNVKKII